MRLRDVNRTGGMLVCLALAASLLGCGGGSGPRAIVKGKVTFAGKALTVGNVMFYGKDKDKTGNATIDKDGNYAMNDAPLGEVKITVFVPKMAPGGMAMMKGPGDKMKGMKDAKSVDPSGSGKSISIMGDMPTNVVPIPDKFGNVDTSGLTYTVKSGEQTHDLVLIP